MEHQINDIHDIYERDEKLQFLREFGQIQDNFTLYALNHEIFSYKCQLSFLKKLFYFNMLKSR
jgi:hypothetical protein